METCKIIRAIGDKREITYVMVIITTVCVTRMEENSVGKDSQPPVPLVLNVATNTLDSKAMRL